MLSMLWLFPLMFASNAFTPTAQMPPGSAPSLTTNRSASQPTPPGTSPTAPPPHRSILAVSGWIAGLTIAFGVIATWRYEKASR